MIIALILFLVVFTPLAFGTVEPWSIFIFEAAVSVITLTWLARSYVKGSLVLRRPSPPVNGSMPIFSGFSLYVFPLLFILLVIFQIIPLPLSVIKTISPAAGEIRTFASSFIQSEPSSFFPLSLYTNSTIVELIKFCFLAIVFFIVINEVVTLKQINFVLGFIFVFGTLVAFFGIIEKFSGTGKIYWMQEVVEKADPFGPFVNYDHYGGYINMIIMIGFGYMLTNMVGSKKLLTGFMTAVMVASLLICKSRGAVLCFLGGLSFMGIMIFALRRNYNRKMVTTALLSILAMIAFVAFFMYWSDWMQVMARLKTMIKLEGNFFAPRWLIWKDSWQLLKSFPLIGIGFGNYEYAFPMVQTAYLHLLWRFTHNDYFQLLIETGPLPFVLVISFLFVSFKAISRKIRKSRSDSLAGLITGCSAAVVTMLLHSFVDFNLHTTSNAFLFVVILALTISLVALSKEFNPESIVIFKLSSFHSKTAITLIMLGIIVFLAIPSLRFFAGDQNFNKAMDSSFKDKEKYFTRSVKAEPGNAVYYDAMGIYFNESAAQSNLPMNLRLTYLARSKQSFEQAILSSPSQGEYWAHYAWLLGNIQARDKAAEAFKRAKQLAPNMANVKNLYDSYSELN